MKIVIQVNHAVTVSLDARLSVQLDNLIAALKEDVNVGALEDAVQQSDGATSTLDQTIKATPQL